MMRMLRDEMLEILKQINSNLLALKKLKELEMREVITKEIERTASTSIRRKMWILSDGTRSTSEISKIINVSRRAVQYFVQECVNSGLLSIDKRGFPVRTIEWVPSEWVETSLLKEAPTALNNEESEEVEKL